MLLSASRRIALSPKWTRDILWRRARAVPSLDLRFADNKSLVDATTGQNLVTFTRASTGTYVDSQGVIKTAVTNLLLRSEEFDVTWGKPAGVTVTANTTEAPNGTQTADTLSGAINIDHNGTNLSQSITATESKSYIFSIYVKSLTATTFSIRLRDNTAASVITAITPTSSWQRVSCTLTTGIGATTLVARVGGANGDVAIWGAQLEQSSTVGEYIPTTSTINSAPRFDHNPTTGESLGLLVEEQRTNLILQSEDFLTTWSTNSSPTRTANTSVAPDGNITADTIGSTVTGSYVSQTVTFTGDGDKAYFCFLKAGTSISTVLNLRDTTAGSSRGSATVTWTGGVPSVSVSGGSLLGVQSFPNGWYRITILASGVIAANTNQFRIQPDVSAGTGNVLIWGFQAENSAFPTSYIPTTTATVTRSADVASITGSNFSSWYRQDEGTVFSDYAERAFSQTHQVVSASNGTTSERISMAINSSNVLDVGVISGATDTFGGNTPTLTAQAYRIGFSYKSDSSGVSANGSAVTDDSAVILPTVSQLDVGARGSGQILNSTIRRLTYFPVRLANETLQRITQ